MSKDDYTDRDFDNAKKSFKLFTLLIILISILALIAGALLISKSIDSNKYKISKDQLKVRLELPLGTTDWKDWNGKTYCKIDSDWYECKPISININQGK